MSKRMLIDATHKEETRVAIMDGSKLAEYDYENQNRRPLKGSIFLAKITRVEPSLQVAFVNFGGNRHGFLPFSEIHPDYFRIPIADREALLAEQDALLQKHDEEEALTEETDGDGDENITPEEERPLDAEEEVGGEADIPEEDKKEASDKDGNISAAVSQEKTVKSEADPDQKGVKKTKGRRGYRGRNENKQAQCHNKNIETTGNEEIDAAQRFRFNLRRKYKIQEVIKRGQVVLVQVNKEERGNKGAAVGTYLSLPGRYCVLMPNSPRAGGVSRKIANHQDRTRMREIVKDLEVPKGMSVIVRTAGVARTKSEIKRDLDYLMRLWGSIRELTLQSTAPALVYEEADLIKRSVRDLYTRDIEEIFVAGDAGYHTAKDFMKMLIPSHVKKVKQYDAKQLPLFHRYQVEGQVNEIGQPEVRLKSGGYLVINPTEALVSVDVNSGKATKGRHIEETALKTNLEAADEVARQLKLRDLGGLVVIDFIDMEERRNNGKVERCMKEALSTDRARVQVGRISSFGLMELSRQRLSSSLIEAQFEQCHNCSGIGLVRTSDAMSILVLRAIEEEGIRARAAQIIVQVTSNVALYILNHKRTKLAQIEERYTLEVLLRVDDTIPASEYRVEVSKPLESTDKEKVQNAATPGPEEEDDHQNNSARRRGRRGGRNRNTRAVEAQQKNNPDIAVDTDARPDQKTENTKHAPAANSKTPDSQSVALIDDDINVGEKEEAPKKKAARKKALPQKKKDVKKEPVTPSVASLHETVNIPPSQKKKGWWNRLVE